jgi:glycosyltransferase involved in cell wall biosynthesis
MNSDHHPRVALLTNVVAPYRLPVWEVLGESVDLLVLYAGLEPNRKGWEKYHQSTDKLKIKRSWGFLMTHRIRSEEGLFDNRYIHFNPGFLWDLIRYRPKAVITGEMGFRTIMALIYGSLFRKPVWVNWEGTVHSEQGLSRFKRVFRTRIVKWAKRWITYGDTSTEYLLSLGVDRFRIVQIQNGVDERAFTTETDPLLNLPKPAVLCVSQFIGRKGIDLLLEAASAVQKQGISFSLTLVGDGPLRMQLEELAKMLGLEQVHFIGSVESEKMPTVYRCSDVLVLPTLLDVWGLVVNEAILSDLTVMGSIYAGCSQELLPKECCFDPRDPTEFAQILQKAVEGKLPKPDPTRLWSCRKNGETMAQAVLESIADR